MKTQVLPLQHKADLISNRMVQYLLIGLLMIASVAFNSTYAQTTTKAEINVKGMVSDEIGPLTGVNIALEGSNVGAITDTDGTFIFPKALQPGDVLVFSYLGYETRRIKIKEDTRFLNLKMVSEAIDIVGAVAVDKPYKSKRSF
ncbi:carboxypeptidase-like regulatory domain-containing protein [Psychroserpens mesophilus]|uniref:carboxypeptidase-like regulatory domain-containing protein n=1 Tax=Psychroserpens mesophilus TaxID=325473 RepID=UPI00058DB02E|nr:carboxypeptidase-like regulatory domain-containing protein [Psychroserpens mesophilus]